jgi:hypothetical protein
VKATKAAAAREPRRARVRFSIFGELPDTTSEGVTVSALSEKRVYAAWRDAAPGLSTPALRHEAEHAFDRAR